MTYLVGTSRVHRLRIDFTKLAIGFEVLCTWLLVSPASKACVVVAYETVQSLSDLEARVGDFGELRFGSSIKVRPGSLYLCWSVVCRLKTRLGWTCREKGGVCSFLYG
jgi:hypothetical protein